jgi:hypothetical protein
VALFTVVLGIVLVHALVWGMVKQMRREGQRLRRIHLAGFWALELVLGLAVWQTGSLSLLVWVAVNAAILGLLTRVSPPRPPYAP